MNGGSNMIKTLKKMTSMVLTVVYIIMCILTLFGIDAVYADSASKLKIGDYIYFGRYNDEPILWRVINIDSKGSPMLFSERIITYKAFDAKGDLTDGRGDKNRIEYGSNFWEKSNLREWLNSSEKKVAFTSNKPEKDNVEYNEYDSEPGFLYGFSKQERDSIMPVTHKNILSDADISVKDGGSAYYTGASRDIERSLGNYDKAYYKNSTDLVYILDVKELHDYVYKRGWEYKKYPTEKAISTSNFHNTGKVGEPGNYWVRTPYRTPHMQYFMSNSGQFFYRFASIGYIGVVPALNLKSDIKISGGKGTEAEPYYLFEKPNITQTDANNTKQSGQQSTPGNNHTPNPNDPSVDAKTPVYNEQPVGKSEIVTITPKVSSDSPWILDRDLTKNHLVEIEYYNGMFIAIGYSGTIKTSKDGLNWSTKTTSSIENLYGLAFGDGLYIAVGENGTILTSTDLEKWETQKSETSLDLHAITYGNKRFVAVGDKNTIITSTDGKQWTSVEIPNLNSTYNLSDIIYNKGKFVVTCDGNMIFTSSDGLRWELAKAIDNLPGATMMISSICYGNKEYVAVGELITGYGIIGIIISSPDGIKWDIRRHPAEDIIKVYYDIKYENGIYIAIGYSNDLIDDLGYLGSLPIQAISKDSINWSMYFNDATSFPTLGIAYGDEKFIAVGHGGQILGSLDGIAWRRAVDLGTSFKDMVYGNGKYVVVGGSGIIISSTDLKKWDIIKHPFDGDSRTLNGIAFGAGRFLAVGDKGLMLSSTDGQNWSTVNCYISENLYSIIYAKNKFIAVGDNGAILTSTDGITWNKTIIENGKDTVLTLHRIRYINDMFMIAGLDIQGILITSKDGIKWTLTRIPEINALYDISYGNGIYIGTGAIVTKGGLIVSKDGINWTVYKVESGHLISMLYDQGNFIIITDKAEGLTTKDGITLTKENIPTSNYLHKIDNINGKIIAIGAHQTIIERTSSNTGK